MARKCSCKICKNKGDTDSFYKVTNDKGINTYYCNQEEYKNDMHEKENRKRLLEYIAIDVFNYEEGQFIHPIMVKKIGEMNSFYPYEVIQECFKETKETIQYWIKEKNFKNEYNMVSYIMKIIEGNVNDIYNKWKYIKQQEEKRASLNVDLGIINEIDNTKVTLPKKNDILMFLDEGDI